MSAPASESKLRRHHFIVTMTAEDDLTEHKVMSCLIDQVAAERELRKRGLSVEKAPLEFGSARVWHAMVRTKQYDKGLDEFYTECVDYEKDPGKNNASDGDGDPVDPTQPAASPDSA